MESNQQRRFAEIDQPGHALTARQDELAQDQKARLGIARLIGHV